MGFNVKYSVAFSCHVQGQKR